MWRWTKCRYEKRLCSATASISELNEFSTRRTGIPPFDNILFFNDSCVIPIKILIDWLVCNWQCMHSNDCRMKGESIIIIYDWIIAHTTDEKFPTNIEERNSSKILLLLWMNISNNRKRSIYVDFARGWDIRTRQCAVQSARNEKFRQINESISISSADDFRFQSHFVNPQRTHLMARNGMFGGKFCAENFVAFDF